MALISTLHEWSRAHKRMVQSKMRFPIRELYPSSLINVNPRRGGIRYIVSKTGDLKQLEVEIAQNASSQAAERGSAHVHVVGQ